MNEVGIFAENCRKYWDAGLPAIPITVPDGLREGNGKRPSINAWQKYANQMPTPDEQEVWPNAFADCNIGLPLGKQSGLIAIDIDTEDPKALGVLDRVLPPSPWTRVGRKGKVLVYKYDGQTTFRIKAVYPGEKEAKTVVEMLSAGTQIVLPPSIHPTTKRPYTANRDLTEVLGEVRSLPPNIEAILRDAFKEAGIKVGSSALGALTNFVAPGARDNTLMSMAGLFASDICRGHKTFLEACQQITAWADNFAAKVYGDNIDAAKGPKKIAECLIKDVTGPKHRILPNGWDEGLSDQDKEAMGFGVFTRDHETWTFDQIKAYFDAGLEKTGVRDNMALSSDLIKDTVLKIAANRSLDALQESSLLRYVIDITGRRHSLTELRRTIADFRAGEIKGTDHTEIAQAVLKDIEGLKGELRYHNEQLWNWCGSHWTKFDDSEVLRHIANEYGSFKAACKAADHYGIMRVIKSLANKPLSPRDEIMGINFVNGFLTEDLTLLPHDPDQGMTYCLEYPYKPEEAGGCHKWLSMLHEYWGDDEDYADKVNALGEAIAITMFGKATSVAKAFCLFGVPHSGKSRILEIVLSLMPPEARTTSTPNMWNDKFGTAPLADKLINFAGELSESKFIDSDTFKLIISGEQVQAQFKGRQLFTFRPKAAHWFATNHLPKARDSSEGFSRRWLFLRFNKKFPEHRRKIDYEKEIIVEERTAIAAWATQFIPRLRNNNWIMTEPPSAVEWRVRLDNELNSVRSFLQDLQDQGRLRLGVEAHKGIADPVTTFDILWTEYRSYCASAGVLAVGSRTFGKRMHELQVTFDFTEEKVLNAIGLQIVQYRSVTFVKRKG